MPPEATPAPSAADFDQAFSVSASPGIRRVWEGPYSDHWYEKAIPFGP
jgi:hypothetical protein